MKPDYEGINWAIYLADCIEIMSGLPEGIVDCAVFSPPFSDLFVYSDSERDMGNCGSHEEFMEHYAYFAQALYRVMKPGRVACVHCSDLPARKSKDGFIGLHDFSGDLIRSHQDAGWVYHARCTIWKDPVIEMQRTKALGLLYKQLKKDSTRSRVGMPDYMLFFRKDQENPDPVTHDPDDLPVSMWQELASPVWMEVNQTKVLNGRQAKGEQDEKHICPLQLDVIERALVMWSNRGDVVFSPFMGIGSEGVCSVKLGRKFIGTELKESYFKQAVGYLRQAESEAQTLL